MYWHWCKRYITFLTEAHVGLDFLLQCLVFPLKQCHHLVVCLNQFLTYGHLLLSGSPLLSEYLLPPLQIREQGKILKNTYCGWTDWSSCWTTRPAISACRVRLSDVVFSTIHVLSTNLKVSPKLPLPASPWIKIHLPRIYSEWKNIQLGSERCEYGYNFWYFTSVCHCNCFLMKLQTIAAFNEIKKLKKEEKILHQLLWNNSHFSTLSHFSGLKCHQFVNNIIMNKMLPVKFG